MKIKVYTSMFTQPKYHASYIVCQMYVKLRLNECRYTYSPDNYA